MRCPVLFPFRIKKKGNVDFNCNKTCGHISDYLHCSHVNVTCLTGYKPVYEEGRCQKGYNLYYTSENDKTIKILS